MRQIKLAGSEGQWMTRRAKLEWSEALFITLIPVLAVLVNVVIRLMMHLVLSVFSVFHMFLLLSETSGSSSGEGRYGAHYWHRWESGQMIRFSSSWKVPSVQQRRRICPHVCKTHCDAEGWYTGPSERPQEHCVPSRSGLQVLDSVVGPGCCEGQAATSWCTMSWHNKS